LNGSEGSSKKYILVTPCKNEEDNLKSLINSITMQTVRPIIWIIVDDGSTDDTSTILRVVQNKYDWIEVLRIEESPRDLGLHLADITKKGFDYAIKFCIQNGLEYNYLGNVDADLILPPSFFENIVMEFENDPGLGVASGGIILTIGNKLVHAKGLPSDEPSGGDMLIRRRCFEDCGGIPQSYSYDTVLKTKSKLNGWKTKRFEEYLATETRDVSSAEGYLKGYLHMGKASHFLNLNPIHVILRSMIKSFRKPYYGGFVYFLSYSYHFLKRDEQIADDEIRKYFWNKWKHVYNERLLRGVNHEIVDEI